MYFCIFVYFFSANQSPQVVINDYPNNSVSANVGDRITLSCDVKGAPKPTKYWQKDGKIVYNCPNKLESRCTYTILRASFEKNNGIHECVGENLVRKVTKQLSVEIKGEIFLNRASLTTFNSLG